MTTGTSVAAQPVSGARGASECRVLNPLGENQVLRREGELSADGREHAARQNSSIPDTSFPDAQVWERVLISELEEEFGPLRSRSTMIAKMALLAATYHQVEEAARQQRATWEAAFLDF